MAGLKHRKDLDGLRAFAILGVMLYHSQPGQAAFDLPGGRIGVDLFFVLSGYLITSLLMAELDASGRIDLLGFYARRVLRLVPPFLLLLVLAWWISVVVPSPDAAPYAATAAAAMSYVANWVEIWRGLGPLGHTWSLAIEQQYYLVWPVALIALHRLTRSRRRMAKIVVWIAVIVMVVRPIVYSIHPRFASFSTVTRADGVLIGSALAFALAEPSPGLLKFLERRSALVFSSTAIVATAALTHWDLLPALYLYGLAIVNVLCAILIGSLTVSKPGAIHAVLASDPFVVIGEVSYGMYLFHIPVFSYIFRVKEWDGAAGVLLAFFVTFVIALFSYMTIEAWARDLKARIGRPKINAPDFAGAPQARLRAAG